MDEIPETVPFAEQMPTSQRLAPLRVPDEMQRTYSGDGQWALPGASQPARRGSADNDAHELLPTPSRGTPPADRTDSYRPVRALGAVLSSVRIQRGRKQDFDVARARSKTEKRAVAAAKDFHMKEDPTRSLNASFVGHTGRVKACCVFAGDKKLLTCADDHTLRIFNVKTGECEAILGCDPSELLEYRRTTKSFPETLGPFGIQETMLQPKINFAELTYEIDVGQAAVFKQRGDLSKELWTTLMAGDGLQGSLTKPYSITLTAEERAPYGIPLRATHFAWGNQLKGADRLSSEQVIELGTISAEASFAVNGGFVYVNAEGKGDDWGTWTCVGDVEPFEVQANAVCTSGLTTLHFSEQIAVDMELRAPSLMKLREEKRFREVTVVPMRVRGARYYAWIFPGEDLKAANGETWVPAIGGGFMYLMSDEENPTREECTKCCFYEHTLGHNNWVRSCCVLKSAGENEVLSCSADRTIRVWDIATRCNTKIMSGHTNWVWDCCEFKTSRGEYRALSVSSDMTMRVWNLTTGGEITELRMLGHSDWVLACCTFSDNGMPRALSGSRDQQLRLWNPDTAECLRIFRGHSEAVLKCDVYDDNGTWKAVSCSADSTIKTWDVSEDAHGTDCATTILGHSSKVSGCVPFYDDQLERWMGVSCGSDTTIRVWDLGSGEEEREMTDPDQNKLRGCAITSDGSKVFTCSGNAIRAWDLDLLRGADRLNDVQSSGQAGVQLWTWWSHMSDHNHKAWAQQLVDVMQVEQHTMEILYGRDPDGLTLLHKLAREPDGGVVVQFLLNHYRVGREYAMADEMSVMDHLLENVMKAEKTIGLISRAGKSHGRSLLGMAMHTSDSKSATMIRVLLEDYCEMTKAVKVDSFSQQVVARYDSFEPISEADLVDLFQEDKFPLDAAAFMEKLPLRTTNGLNSKQYLEEESHKDLLGSQGMIVRAAMQMQPVHPERPWWDDIISPQNVSSTVLATIKEICFCRRCQRTIHRVTAIETSLVPIVASSPRQQESKSGCKDCCERTVCTGCSRAQEGLSDNVIPFSGLLHECWEYAKQYNRVELFESACLKAIVHHKWETCCRFIFIVSFARVLSFTALLTVVIVHNSASSHLFYDIARWYCICLDILMIKFALHESFTRGLFTFLANSRNWIETFVTVVSFESLIRLELRSQGNSNALSSLSGSDDGSGGSSSRDGTLQAVMMLLAWGQLAKWLQGFESLFFTMEVVTQNVRTLADFLVILVVVIVAYGLAFYLLMRGSTGTYANMKPPEACFSWSCEKLTAQLEDTTDDYAVDSVVGSLIQVFAMMQGEFSTQVYEKPWRDELKKGVFTLEGSLSYFLFSTFMLFVPIVMVNVLIASMQQSYDRVYLKKEGYMLMERASIILRLEDLVMVESSLRPASSASLNAFSRLMQVLCSFKIRGDQQIVGTYLHVLSSVESGMYKRPGTNDQKAKVSDAESSTSTAELEWLKQRNRALIGQNRALANQLANLSPGIEASRRRDLNTQSSEAVVREMER